jgi:hypothetical protein
MRRLLFFLLRVLATPGANRFRKALEQPHVAQRQVLADIVSDLKQTEYGRHLGVETVDDFLSKVPVVDYDTLAPWVEKQKELESGALVAGPVLFYEKTSGSTGAAKYIPYTKSLRASFTRMFLIWAHDVVSHGPGIGRGKLYFSVSPSFDDESQTEAGVSVGMEDDAEYLSGFWRYLMAPFFLSPPGLGKVRDPDAFKWQLSQSLLKCRDLESISVWNPSFFTVMLDYIESHRQALLEELGSQISKSARNALEKSPIDWQEVWPELKFVSAWADANAAPLAQKLQEKLPHALVQGKGLLATEAPMTIPMIGVDGGVPLITEVYLEFENDNSDILSVEALENGSTYGIVVSQKGGLVRYRMGDQVQVVDRIGSTPTFRFVGRNNRFSDLVGEKLNESFVREVLGELSLEGATFRTLMPVRIPQDHYVLLLDHYEGDCNVLGSALEKGLSKAYHYRHARALGQLSGARAVVLDKPDEAMNAYHTRAGRRIGDMKQSYLLSTPADRELADLFVKAAS